MGLQKCGLNLNNVSKELQPHGSLAFPCAGYASRHTDLPEDIIPDRKSTRLNSSH